MLKIEGMNKKYIGIRKKNVLSNVNINVLPNSIVGIVGENGAGKTTLLKAIERNIVKRKAYINGKNSYNPNSEVISYFGGINSDTDKLIMYFSDELNFDVSKFKLFLKEFKIDIYTPYKELSTGKKALRDLLFYICFERSIYLLDEPFLGVDILSKEAIKKLLINKLDKNKIIFISTNEVEDLNGTADDIIHIGNGKVKYSNLDKIKNSTGKSINEILSEGVNTYDTSK